MLKTKWCDIKDTVFDNETEAIMYITKDIYSDSYIVAIPIIIFSWSIMDKHDYDYLRQSKVLDSSRKEKLIQAIKKAIAEF